MTALSLFAMGLAGLGALLAYAGASNQRLSATPRPALRWVGWALLAIALLALLTSFGPTAAVFTWMTMVMLIWSIIPLVIAWRDARRRPAVT